MRRGVFFPYLPGSAGRITMEWRVARNSLLPRRSPELDQPLLGRRMSLRERPPIRIAKRPKILGAEPGIVDPAGVLGPAGFGCLARSGKPKHARGPAGRQPTRQLVQAGPERQVLDILLAATIRLEADRWHHAASLAPRGIG